MLDMLISRDAFALAAVPATYVPLVLLISLAAFALAAEATPLRGEAVGEADGDGVGKGDGDGALALAAFASGKFNTGPEISAFALLPSGGGWGDGLLGPPDFAATAVVKVPFLSGAGDFGSTDTLPTTRPSAPIMLTDSLRTGRGDAGSLGPGRGEPGVGPWLMDSLRPGRGDAGGGPWHTDSLRTARGEDDGDAFASKPAFAAGTGDFGSAETFCAFSTSAPALKSAMLTDSLRPGRGDDGGGAGAAFALTPAMLSLRPSPALGTGDGLLATEWPGSISGERTSALGIEPALAARELGDSNSAVVCLFNRVLGLLGLRGSSTAPHPPNVGKAFLHVPILDLPPAFDAPSENGEASRGDGAVDDAEPPAAGLRGSVEDASPAAAVSVGSLGGTPPPCSGMASITRGPAPSYWHDGDRALIFCCRPWTSRSCGPAPPREPLRSPTPLTEPLRSPPPATETSTEGFRVLA